MSCSTAGFASCTTSGVTTTSGNLVVAAIGWNFNSDWISTTSDSKSNSWTNAIPNTFNSSFTSGQSDFVPSITGGGSHTFTTTGSAGTGSYHAFLGVVEISGQSASPLDKTATGVALSGTSHTTSSTSTTAQNNEALVGWGSTFENVTMTTDSGAGWTERANINQSDGSFVMGTKIVSSTGTYAYTYTTSASTEEMTGIMTFKEASGSRQKCIGCGIDKKIIGDR